MLYLVNGFTDDLFLVICYIFWEAFWKTLDRFYKCALSSIWC